MNRKLILSEHSYEELSKSPDFKFKSVAPDDSRNVRRAERGEHESLQDLIKNSKLEATDTQQNFIGEGISPNKKRPQPKKPTLDYESQQNKEKTRRILQNFDFNKLFYPSTGVHQQRNAQSLNEARRSKHLVGHDEM